MTATLEATPTSATSPHDPTIGFRRVAGALALPLAFALQLVSNVLYARAVSVSGLTDTNGGAEALRFYGTFPVEMQLATLLALLGSMLAIPGLLAALRVLRPARPRLALWAAILMIAGYVCYFGIAATNFDTITLAALHPDAGDVLDSSTSLPAAIPVFLAFVVGNLIGTLLLGICVILSRGIPWWVGALIIGWPVGHLVNILGAGEWFAVGGGVLEVLGLVFLASRALRTTDLQWASRG